jgi:hypothetical protein
MNIKTYIVAASVILAAVAVVLLQTPPQTVQGATFTVDATSSNSFTSEPATLGLTNNSTTNQLTLVCIAMRPTGTPEQSVSSVKYNGADMTLATSTRASALNTLIYYLAATTTGAKNIVVSTSANVGMRVFALSVTGVTASSPLDSVSGTFGSTQNVSDNATVTGEEAIFDCLIHEDTSSSQPAAFQTKIPVTNDGDEGNYNTGASYVFSTTTETLGMKWTAGGSDTYAHSVAWFRAASAGGGGTPAANSYATNNIFE